MQSISIPSSELLVGDVFRVHTGMVIPADSILIQTGHNSANNQYVPESGSNLHEIIVQEEFVTGEQDYKRKIVIDDSIVEEKDQNDLSNILYAKSYIV